MTDRQISGLIPILATPFGAAGELDVVSLRRLVEFQLRSGVDGVAIFGMASEGFALTNNERSTILDEVVDVVAGAVPIIAGVGATSTVTAIEQAAPAVDAGVDALMVLPPFMVKPGPAQLVDFYGEIAATTGRHIMVQDAPGVTGVAMPVSLVVELSGLAGVESIKVESPPTAARIGSIADAVPADFLVLGGQNSQMLLAEYANGAVGTMPACEFPDLVAPVLADWNAGDHERATEAFTRLLPLILFGLQPGLAWAVHKEVLVMRGVIANSAVRSPALPITARMRDALAVIVEQLDLSTTEAR